MRDRPGHEAAACLRCNASTAAISPEELSYDYDLFDDHHQFAYLNAMFSAAHMHACMIAGWTTVTIRKRTCAPRRRRRRRLTTTLHNRRRTYRTFFALAVDVSSLFIVFQLKDYKIVSIYTCRHCT